ncbi:unnamed protein product [Camellia sinensis]
MNVPYPFGIEDPECSMNESFLLKYIHYDNSGLGSHSKLMLGDLQILNISVEEGTVMVNVSMAYYCYNKSSDGFNFYSNQIDLNGSPFTFSDTQNKLTAVGCDTVAFMEDSAGMHFESGCISLCYQPVNLMGEDSCSGLGCCQTQIPSGVKGMNMSIRSLDNYSYVRNFSPCSYAFLASEDWFGFSSIDLRDISNVNRESPAVLDWGVGEGRCESIDTSYACGLNTMCINSNNGPGYRCVCKPGYQGNPYLSQPQGCQDINECMDLKTYPCKWKCKNTPGNYTCHCPLGMFGDGKVDCVGFRLTPVFSICGVAIIVVIIILVFWIRYKRRNKLRNFLKNGGSLLKNQKIKIFSADELEKATNMYDENQRLGQGGFGSVYKGTLPDKSLVAVKKANKVDKTQIKSFQKEAINEQVLHEINMISQVNHKHLVKLLGLCLETKVPLLVYEFVSNGTLFKHLHIVHSEFLKLWSNRLRIAAETAMALDYLHSLAVPPIIHRDVKSTNILLDENHTVKVSDFGSSVLIPPGQSFVATKVQGTLGYLDPEYLITSVLTVKSDVYSFGVVLMELLTGWFPKPNPNSDETRNTNIIQYFITSVEQKKFSQVLNNYEVSDGREGEQIEAVAELAVRCLNRSGIERPTMKEVADQLLGHMRLQETFHAQEQPEETESLLGHMTNINDDMFDSDLENNYKTYVMILNYKTCFDIGLP